jgi:glycosyltransferase involved in cell wall biosynthesis
MNVLFLDQFNELGGAQQCLLDLVGGITRHRLFAALPGDGPLASALRSHGVQVIELPEMSYSHGRKSAGDVVRFTLDTIRLSRRLRRIVRDRAIDLVYVNGPRLLPAAALAAKRFVFHGHSYLDKRYAAALAKWSLRGRNARALASSHFVASALRPRSVRVIYNGVREIPFRPPAPEPGRPWRIGIVGRIAQEKGQVDFVAAARILTGRGLHAEYRIQGEPLFSDSTYLERVRTLSEGLPLVFAGWSDNVAAVFAELDLLVVASSWVEANPRVIIEAFSAGVPVVAYPSGGIPELIEDGVTGVLLGSATPESLAEAIEKLLSDRERMNRIAHAARAAWEERFTVQRYVREVLEFLETSPAGSTAPQRSQAMQP